MSEMLTGSGAPTKRTVGEKGQQYKDTITGDIYECVISSEWSTIHHAPVPGYHWKLIHDGNPEVTFPYPEQPDKPVSELYFDIETKYSDPENDVYTLDKTFDEILEAYNAGKTLRGRSYAFREVLPLVRLNVGLEGFTYAIFAGMCYNTLKKPVYRRMELKPDNTLTVTDYTFTIEKTEVSGPTDPSA